MEDRFRSFAFVKDFFIRKGEIDMKKRRNIMIVILAIICICSISGCEEKKEENVYVKDYISEKGTAKDPYGNEFKYSYHLPEIQIKSEEAGKINEEIKQTLGTKVEEILDLIKKNEQPEYLEVSWEQYCYKDILCLVIMKDDPVYADYVVYCYDLKKDQRIGNEEIMEALGVKEEDVIKELKRKAVQTFDQKYTESPYNEEFLEMYYIRDLIERSQTLSNISKDTISLYIKDDKCRAVVTWYTPSGEGYYHESYELDFKEKEDLKNKKAEDRFIEAELKDNRAFISFHDKDEASVYLNGAQVEFDKQYEVDGLYSDYEDIYICSIGHEYQPYLILRTKEGRLEFANILNGIKGGKLAVSAVPGIKGVTKISSDVREYGEGDAEISAVTAIAENDKGDTFDLMWCVSHAGSGVPFKLKTGATLVSNQIIHSVESGGQYSGIYFMDIEKDGNKIVFEEALTDAEVNVKYEGTYFCQGMSEEGVIYSYMVDAQNGHDSFGGTMAWKYGSDEDVIQIKVLSGTELFDRPGEYVEFHVASE